MLPPRAAGSRRRPEAAACAVAHGGAARNGSREIASLSARLTRGHSAAATINAKRRQFYYCCHGKQGGVGRLIQTGRSRRKSSITSLRRLHRTGAGPRQAINDHPPDDPAGRDRLVRGRIPRPSSVPSRERVHPDLQLDRVHHRLGHRPSDLHPSRTATGPEAIGSLPSSDRASSP